MRCASGAQAVVEVKQLRRSRRLRAELPLPSSLPTTEPLPLPGTFPWHIITTTDYVARGV